MKTSKYIRGALLFIAGLLAGAAATTWQTSRQWQQWLMDFNVSPLLSEVTYGIKELRQGNAAKLETTLTETAWRNIGLLSTQVENGLPMPPHADTTIKYHCDHNAQQPQQIGANLIAERGKVCARLLQYYSQRSQS